MTRRELIKAALGSAAIAGRSGSQSPIVYRPYYRCLPETLKRWAADAYAARSKALDAIGSPEQIRARQQWARDTFWSLIGGRPESWAALRLRRNTHHAIADL